VYKAWLSALGPPAEHAINRVGDGGWVRTDGRVFATTLAALANGDVKYPPRIDEHGNDLGTSPLYAFTGSSPIGVDDSNNDCAGWTIPSGNGAVGLATGGSPYWSRGPFATTMGCNLFQHLYCFRSDGSALMTLPTVVGRPMFASSALFNASMGRDAGDLLCNQESSGARALLALTTESPAQRMGLSSTPLLRSDTVVLFEHGTDLLDAGSLLAPIERDSAGHIVIGNGWTGSPSPGVSGTISQTCSNWSTSSSMNGAVAALNDSAPTWPAAVTATCASMLPLICIGP
jgi:hypothetical protein